MKVLTVPNSLLRVKTKPIKKVTPQLLQTIKLMMETTKTFVDPEGVGLASTQVGLAEQFFVAKIDEQKFKAFFNPTIEKFSKSTKVYLEGCLSIPDYWGEVIRSAWVDVSYLDKKGQRIKERLRGVPAWIFQHECDHLQGKLFVDLLLEQKGKMYKVVGRDRAGSEIFEEVKI